MPTGRVAKKKSFKLTEPSTLKTSNVVKGQIPLDQAITDQIGKCQKNDGQYLTGQILQGQRIKGRILTGQELLIDMRLYCKKVAANRKSARDFLIRLGVMTHTGKAKKLIRT